MPSALTEVKIVPVITKKGLDATKIPNYRPIALATCASKLLERLLLGRLTSYLETSDNQFGYKRKIGCEMAVFSIKQVISFYSQSNTPIYATYLDASQAFNKVDHRILIEKLMKRGLPGYFINLLINWFDNQKFFVSWGKSKSESFSVLQGVRQGGILSAYLFAVYMDDLSVALNDTGIGAIIGIKRVNHLIYADDICILASTLSALRNLLQVCNEYAGLHNLDFNPNKTEMQFFVPNFLFGTKDEIGVFFNSVRLTHTKSVTYLGYLISSKCKNKSVILDDEIEIKKRKCEIYMRAYMIRNVFVYCSVAVKQQLFHSYLDSIYCCSLWNFKIKRQHSIMIAYNNALRIIFGLHSRCSASQAFVLLNIGNV